MVHGKNRIPYRIDRRLTGLAEPDYDATISFGLPFEPGRLPIWGIPVYFLCVELQSTDLFRPSLVLSQLEYNEHADADSSPLPSNMTNRQMLIYPLSLRGRGLEPAPYSIRG